MEMAAHSSTLACQISQTAEPGRQRSQTRLSDQTVAAVRCEEEPLSGDPRASIPGTEDRKDGRPRASEPRRKPAPAAKHGGRGRVRRGRGGEPAARCVSTDAGPQPAARTTASPRDSPALLFSVPWSSRYHFPFFLTCTLVL